MWSLGLKLGIQRWIGYNVCPQGIHLLFLFDLSPSGKTRRIPHVSCAFGSVRQLRKASLQSHDQDGVSIRSGKAGLWN